MTSPSARDLGSLAPTSAYVALSLKLFRSPAAFYRAFTVLTAHGIVLTQKY